MRQPSRFEKRAGQFHSSREAWAKVNPAAFADGSMQQAMNALHCAVEDIERLHAERAELIKACKGLLAERSNAALLSDASQAARAAIANTE